MEALQFIYAPQKKMILANELINATFLKRSNRYLGVVRLNNCDVEVFIPNPGRMKELLINGADVLLRKVDNKPQRKTGYDLVVVKLEKEWVCIDSLLPNRFIYEFLNQNGLIEFSEYNSIKKEVAYQNSRFDFYLSNDLKLDKGCFIEAKSCTLVEQGVALFPDAPTKRGTRHLNELSDAVAEGYRCYAIIVIQRGDANLFKPNVITDPEFAEAMKKAVNNGVEVIAISTILVENEIRFLKRVEVQIC